MRDDAGMTERVIRYAGQDVTVLAGEDDPFAMVRMEVPAGFGGPPPHTHHDFDEAIYVLEGELIVLDGNVERTVAAGGLALAPRGRRHSFRNPAGLPVPVLGIWTPAPALRFLEDIGAVLPAAGPPDRELLAEVYRRHNSVMG
jgi:mannose-6-phosphate isomerase-like protein (cupin superfamily)